MDMKFDVVIPAAPKDYPKLLRSVTGILANSLNTINKIYMIAKDTEVLTQFQANQLVQLLQESCFPFTKSDIQAILKQKCSTYDHASWYYQQLLKFYVFEVIKDASDHLLVLDADFVFRQKTAFITSDGKSILAHGYPFKWLLSTQEYPEVVDHIHVEFAKRFVLGWKAVSSFSGAQHHMVFQKEIMADLFSTVESYHKATFWQAFMNTVQVEKWDAASEYVIYHHFALSRYPAAVTTRHLNSYDIIHDDKENACIMHKLDRLILASKFEAVGCHAFTVLRERIKTMDYIPKSLKSQMLGTSLAAFILQLDNGKLQIEPILPKEMNLLKLITCLTNVFPKHVDYIDNATTLKSLVDQSGGITSKEFMSLRRAIQEEFEVLLPFYDITPNLTVDTLAVKIEEAQKNRTIALSHFTLFNPKLEISIAETVNDIEEFKSGYEQVFKEVYGITVEHEDYLAKHIIVLVVKFEGKVVGGVRLFLKAPDMLNQLPCEKHGLDLTQIDPNIANYICCEYGKCFMAKNFRGRGLCDGTLIEKAGQEAQKRGVKYVVIGSQFNATTSNALAKRGFKNLGFQHTMNFEDSKIVLDYQFLELEAE
jgi:hypothetical protein